MKSGIWLGAAALALAAACSNGAPQPAATVTVTATPPASTKEEILAQGAYIVSSVGGCNDCHTPMTPAGPDMTKSLSGSTLTFAPLAKQPWAAKAPAIAGLPPGYTEAGLKKFLMTGEPEDGSPALPPMPQYRMNEADATAVAAYLGSLPKPVVAVAATPAPAKPK